MLRGKKELELKEFKTVRQLQIMWTNSDQRFAGPSLANSNMGLASQVAPGAGNGKRNAMENAAAAGNYSSDVDSDAVVPRARQIDSASEDGSVEGRRQRIRLADAQRAPRTRQIDSASEDDGRRQRMRPADARPQRAPVDADDDDNDDAFDNLMPAIRKPRHVHTIRPLSTARRRELGRDHRFAIANYECDFAHALHIEHPEDVAKFFLANIDPARGQNYAENLMIGEALYTSFLVRSKGKLLTDPVVVQAREAGFRAWCSFNPQNDTAARARLFHQHFSQIKETLRRTHRTLAWFCRIDKPEAYGHWLSDWVGAVVQYMIERGVPSREFLARMATRLLWLDVIQGDDNAIRMYNTSTHGWDRGTENDVGNLILYHLLPLLDQYAQQINVTSAAGATAIKTLTTLTTKELLGGHKESIAKTVASELLDKTFLSRVNANLGLLRFVNGVCETRLALPGIQDMPTYVNFRTGTPEDWLEKTTRVEYPLDWTPQHPAYLDYIEWTHKTWDGAEDAPWDPVNQRPAWEQRPAGARLLSEAMRIDLASFAYGGNADKIFRLWIGHTNAGKSEWGRLMEEAYGESGGKLPLTMFTGKPPAQGGANSELAATENMRVVASEETNRKDALDGARMKSLTGNTDTQWMRGLYQNGRVVPITWKPIIHSNSDPLVVEGGDAFDGRAMAVEFPANFYDPRNATLTLLQQWTQRMHIKDSNFSSRRSQMIQAYWFDTITCGRFNDYIRLGTGTSLHPAIAARTVAFVNSNNPMKGFLAMCIQIAQGQMVPIPVAFKAYRAFCVGRAPKEAIYTQEMFCREFHAWARTRPEVTFQNNQIMNVAVLASAQENVIPDDDEDHVVHVV